MLPDLIASGTAVVYGALLEEGLPHGKGFPSEFRGYDTSLPVEVDVGGVDAADTPVAFLIAVEDPLIVDGYEAFEVRPVPSDLICQGLKDGYALSCTDGEEDYVPELHPLFHIAVDYIAQAFLQGGAGCDNVSDHEGGVIHQGQLPVFYIQTCHILAVEDSFTGEE